MKHKKISIYDFDDKPLYLPYLPIYFRHRCCDCGLRHLVIVERYRKGIRMGYAVDFYGTEDIRKLEKIKVVKGDVK